MISFLLYKKTKNQRPKTKSPLCPTGISPKGGETLPGCNNIDLDFWYVGMLVCWYVGMLVCWYVEKHKLIIRSKIDLETFSLRREMPNGQRDVLDGKSQIPNSKLKESFPFPSLKGGK